MYFLYFESFYHTFTDVNLGPTDGDFGKTIGLKIPNLVSFKSYSHLC